MAYAGYGEKACFSERLYKIAVYVIVPFLRHATSEVPA